MSGSQIDTHNGETYFVQGMVKVRKYGMSAKRSRFDSLQIAKGSDIRSASAMCTPAIAEGLSKRTSASLHCSQESTRTV